MLIAQALAIVLDSSPTASQQPPLVHQRAPPPPLDRMSSSTIDLEALLRIPEPASPVPWYPADQPPSLPIKEVVDILTSLEAQKRYIISTETPKRSTGRPTPQCFVAHLEQLVQWGKMDWKEVSPTDFWTADAPYDARLKSSGTACRPIWSAIPANQSMNRPPKVRLPRIHESIDLAFEEDCDDLYAVSIDMTGWFGQIPWRGNWLRIKIKRATAGEHAGKVLVWAVLPQGWSWSPIIAQAISEHLLGDLCVKGIIYDNYLLTGSYEKVAADTKTFLERCDSVGAEVKQTKSTLTPSREVIHCGTELRMKERTYRNEPEWAEKVAKLFDLCARSDYITNRQAYEVAGKTNHLLTVRKIPFACHRPIITAMSVIGRRVQRGHSWEGRFAVNTALRASLKSLHSILLKNEPIRWKKWTVSEWHIYVDASKTWGIGWAVFDPQGQLVLCDHRAWTAEEQELDIGVLEAFALREAWQGAKKIIPEEAGRAVYVDNTAEFGAVAKGHCKNMHIDRVIRDLLPFQAELVRIPSEYMIADCLSRGLSPEDTLKCKAMFEWEHQYIQHITAMMHLKNKHIPTRELGAKFEIEMKNVSWNAP